MTPLCCSARSTALRKGIGSAGGTIGAMHGGAGKHERTASAASLAAQPTRVILGNRGALRASVLYLVKRFEDIWLLQSAESFAGAVETGRQSQ